MLLSNGKCLVLSCDCKRCRSPGKQAKSAAYFFDAKGEKSALEAAKRAGWRINGDGFCIAPGHSLCVRLEPQNKSENDGIEID